MAQSNLYGIKDYADLLKALQNGVKFCYLMQYRDGTKHLDPVLTADDKYIRWRHFGSSANPATVRDLEFVITRIFKMTLSDFLIVYIWA